MKKRLRKKLRLREFQEMGFHISFELAISDDDKALFGEFWDRLVGKVEANSLQINGAIGGLFVWLNRRGSATERHREILRQWLQQQPEVSNVVVGPLEDAWYVHG